MPAATRVGPLVSVRSGQRQVWPGFPDHRTDGAPTHERGAGSYTWGGINNTHFWVDPKNGIGVVILTQVLPFYNATSMAVVTRLEKPIYEHLQ